MDFIHVITDAKTGAVTNKPFTQEEIDAYLAAQPQPPTAEENLANIIEQVRVALQGAIDQRARSHGFSGGNALMLYVGFPNPFQALAQQFATWEASVWFEAEQYKQEVLAGTKNVLTPAEAVAAMPEYPL